MNNLDNLSELRAIASESRLISKITCYSDLKSINALKSLISKRILEEAEVNIDTSLIQFKPLWQYNGVEKPLNLQRLIYLVEVEFNDGTTRTYIDKYN